jgi:hypothetical protein
LSSAAERWTSTDNPAGGRIVDGQAVERWFVVWHDRLRDVALQLRSPPLVRQHVRVCTSDPTGGIGRARPVPSRRHWFVHRGSSDIACQSSQPKGTGPPRGASVGHHGKLPPTGVPPFRAFRGPAAQVDARHHRTMQTNSAGRRRETREGGLWRALTPDGQTWLESSHSDVAVPSSVAFTLLSFEAYSRGMRDTMTLGATKGCLLSRRNAGMC